MLYHHHHHHRAACRHLRDALMMIEMIILRLTHYIPFPSRDRLARPLQLHLQLRTIDYSRGQPVLRMLLPGGGGLPKINRGMTVSCNNREW